ncbi:hypothetical protein B5S29_g3091 [[Candida] boidinii]|nr:hypothetical protein B5S29_g3091 [[Candida] boidinii]
MSNQSPISEDLITMFKFVSEEGKKYKSCTNCRKSKLKCDYNINSRDPICEKCKAKNLDCVFEQKFNERKAINNLNDRITKIDTMMNNLMQASEFQNQYFASNFEKLSNLITSRLSPIDVQYTNNINTNSDPKRRKMNPVEQPLVSQNSYQIISQRPQSQYQMGSESPPQQLLPHQQHHHQQQQQQPQQQHQQNFVPTRNGISFIPSLRNILNSNDDDSMPSTLKPQPPLTPQQSSTPSTSNLFTDRSGMSPSTSSNVVFNDIINSNGDLNLTKKSSMRNDYSDSNSEESYDVDSKDYLQIQIKSTDKAELIEFFVENLSRYLPVVIVEQISDFKSKVLKNSLLLSSVLTVSSIYLEKFSNLTETFKKVLEKNVKLLNQEDFNCVNNREDYLMDCLLNVIALLIGSCWLGTNFSFSLSILASDTFGRLLPPPKKGIVISEQLRPLFCSVGLGTYLIENRLRIIHDKPLRCLNTITDQFRKRRDAYLPFFINYSIGFNELNSNPLIFGRLGDATSSKTINSLNSNQLKSIAYVELTAIISNFQSSLSSSSRRSPERAKLDFESNLHWNSHLNGWLSEWIGKLTVHIKVSSWKPVLLYFHFAKFLLNINYLENFDKSNINSKENQDQKEKYLYILSISKTSALDILDMLFDNDIQRLIRVSPVFFPTAFITSGAFILKLIHISKIVDYDVDKTYLLNSVSFLIDILNEKISVRQTPVYEILKKLDKCYQNLKLSEKGKETDKELDEKVNKTAELTKPINPLDIPLFASTNLLRTLNGEDQYFTKSNSTFKSMLTEGPISVTTLDKVPAISNAVTLTTDAKESPNKDKDNLDKSQNLPGLQEKNAAVDIWEFDFQDKDFKFDAHTNKILEQFTD